MNRSKLTPVLKLVFLGIVFCLLFDSLGAEAQSIQPTQNTLWLGNDTVGSAFQTDTAGHVIHELTQTPVTGIAWDGSHLYFADTAGNFTVRNADGSLVEGGAFFVNTFGTGEDLAWDSKRRVLWRIVHSVSDDTSSPVLQEIDPAQTSVCDEVSICASVINYPLPADDLELTTLGGLGVAYDSTRDLLYVSFCQVGCASLSAGVVKIVDPNTGSLVESDTHPDAVLFRTTGMATGGLAYDPKTDTLWVGSTDCSDADSACTDGELFVVRHMDLSGNTISSFVRPRGGAFVDGLEEIIASSTTTIQFSPSTTPETQIATVGQPTDPDAQSLALTLASVTNAINVNVTFFYEPTDLSTGSHGIGIADGVCETGATEAQDFDCRLAANFTYRNVSTGQVVPHIVASHDLLGVWVRVTATRVSDGQPAVAGVDYQGPVDWYYAWNTNPSLSPSPNPDYTPGWNNLNPQMFDRPGENVDIAFVKNITTYSKFNCSPTCVGTNDPGTGGRTLTLNDIVVADPPNPLPGGADKVLPLAPFPSISPFIYLSGIPMPVAFQLKNATTGVFDPGALVPPHSVNVAVLDSTGQRHPVQTFPGFPTTFTYNPFLKVYTIFLSPGPYVIGNVYQLQINSDLFPQPVNANFKVIKFK